MITAEGEIGREYIRVAPSTGAAAPGPGGLTARLLRMSKQTRSQTTKHGEPELSAPAIGGEDAAHSTDTGRGAYTGRVLGTPAV